MAARDFDVHAPRRHAAVAPELRTARVADDWRRARERLDAALAVADAIRTRVPSGDPAWLAAQLAVAEARRRLQAVADQVDALDTDGEHDA
jgi:hypothetical protein